ncbi:hypothetical protein BDP27DRAFT_1338180 [Rhodocollybia butyracea]|uniref:Uncharacterized protein n=1 Tax=Rhodocollybia butyracea TaxID=206335 RepID=A0A9P5U1B5_9AGAR|nr:hypothetical protein BDP27DRAFT_1338180 [Rhodocollybia butyracea]
MALIGLNATLVSHFILCITVSSLTPSPIHSRSVKLPEHELQDEIPSQFTEYVPQENSANSRQKHSSMHKKLKQKMKSLVNTFR